MLTYPEAVDKLQALGLELASPSPGGVRRKFDLDHMGVLAHALGDPQRQFPSILIAGTNGKGSTAATLSSILHASGYRTALYTSPHLHRVNERIQMDGREIADHDFARLFTLVDETARKLLGESRLPHLPSFFEVLTALAFLFFAEQQVDFAVLEVGLGGRLDATNIVDPVLCILTDISLDHQEYLGNTIAAITREKAGILRPNATLITLPQHPEANQAIGEAAAGLNLHAISAAQYVPAPGFTSPQIEGHGLERNRYHVFLEDELLEVDSPLPGHHQQRNIALAIAAANHLRSEAMPPAQVRSAKQRTPKITKASIEQGIQQTQWPGRLERIVSNLLLDVAHNPAGAWTLRAAIAHLPEAQPRTLLFSCLRDKDLDGLAKILFPLFDPTGGDPARTQDHIVLAPIPNARGVLLEELLAAAQRIGVPAHAAPHLGAALALARTITPPEGMIVATGSVYLVGEIRRLATGP